jgi:Mg2+-importing ATPase
MNTANQFPNQFWNVPVEELLRSLDSSSEGLGHDEAIRRLEQYGPNLLEAKMQVSPLRLFLRQFQSPIMLILLLATLVSAFLKDWPDAAIILVIVLGSALLSFVQEHNASQAVEKLRAQLTLKASLLRDGQPQSIPVEQVVPGDIVLLSAGSLIPADGVVLEAKDFFVNQAVLTGETYPVEKKPDIVAARANLAERTNTVFMGTSARSGSARVLIVQTGLRTVYGQIAGRLSLRPPENEFQRGIRHLGFLLSEVMFILVLAIFAFNVFFHKPVLDSLLFSIALAVGLTPQLLPAIININLSKGSQAMAGGGVIVRRLESIENFGSMDVLCTDKTGTLTLGVVQLDAALNPEGQASDRVFLLAYLNAYFQTGLSNPLDEAILSKTKLDIGETIKVDEIPYDFVRKRLSVVIQEGGSYLLVTKGALENVLAVCAQAQMDGRVVPMDASLQARVRERYASWSAQGYRVLGVAVRPIEHQSTPYSHDDEQEMAFAGFLLFFDPPKPGVKEAIQDLARFGVQLKIITGDNHLVAQHTAEAVGLEVTGVLTGSQLDDLHDEALIHAAERANLFSEVDPNQKERIILALKKTGHVVGYMGDGINDAPSLHSADVGISVENAVDVAKEAADFVLLRPDLAVLHQGILQGRKTFANTLKYVFMATSANFGNMFSMAGASLLLPFLPMLPKQILLINFLTDLPEMAIASDTVDDTFIERPHRWDIKFIRRFMLVFGPVSSAFDFMTFALLLWGLRARPELFHTGWFVESVLSAALVVFALRTRQPFRNSRPSRGMQLATAGVALVALALPYTPLARLFGFVPIPALFLLAVAAIVVIYFAVAELTKRWFFRRFES